MKTHRQAIPILLAALIFAGCATLDPGADPVVVRAEQVYAEAFDTFDTLFKLDYDNRSYVLEYAPEVHKQINALKPKSKVALKNVHAVIAAYKANRDENNKANLTTYLATLQALLNEARTYTTQISKEAP